MADITENHNRDEDKIEDLNDENILKNSDEEDKADINKSEIGNLINEQKNSENVSSFEKISIVEFQISMKKLALLKKEHKYLNNQLHIMSHKVQYKIDPLKRKTFSNLTINNTNRSNNNNNINHENKDEVNLPKIQNKNLTNKNESKQSEAFGLYKKPFPIPKFKYDEIKKKNLMSKQILEENKQIRLKQAKYVKEANRLMRENVLMLKEKVKEENRQKKKIVDTRYEFIKNSISNFQKLKQDYIKNIITSDIQNEMKEIQEKRKQLVSLKMLHEKRLMNKIKKEGKDNMITNDGSIIAENPSQKITAVHTYEEQVKSNEKNKEDGEQ